MTDGRATAANWVGVAGKANRLKSRKDGEVLEMKTLGRVSVSCMTLGSVLMFTTTVMAGTVISVTSPPDLSSLIDNGSLIVSWSQSRAYSDVNIGVLVDSALVGETPTADAYLSRNAPDFQGANEVAYTPFTVPQELPVCWAGCGAWVTLFSGLNFGPGTYFLALAPDPVSVGVVGWFPAENPTVVEDVGVSLLDGSFNFVVTGTAATQTPETGGLVLVGTAVIGLVGSRIRLTRPKFHIK